MAQTYTHSGRAKRWFGLKLSPERREAGAFGGRRGAVNRDNHR